MKRYDQTPQIKSAYFLFFSSRASRLPTGMLFISIMRLTVSFSHLKYLSLNVLVIVKFPVCAAYSFKRVAEREVPNVSSQE